MTLWCSGATTRDTAHSTERVVVSGLNVWNNACVGVFSARSPFRLSGFGSFVAKTLFHQSFLGPSVLLHGPFVFSRNVCSPVTMLFEPTNIGDL